MSEPLLPLTPTPIYLHGECRNFTLTCINIKFGILLPAWQGIVMQEHLFRHLAIHVGHTGLTAPCRWVSTSLYLSLLTVILL